MFDLPMLSNDSKIILTIPLESKVCVDITIDVLNKFSIQINNNNYKEFRVKGNQKYNVRDYRIEGDFSKAAFWIVVDILDGKITCFDLDTNSFQPDKVIIDIIINMRVGICINQIEIEKSKTKGIG